MLSKPLKELSAGLPPLEAAKLSVVGAFAINTLFYIYLKTQGVDPAQHPVIQELERVKGYFKKIREATAGQAAGETKNAHLNVGAANRFIAAALGPEGSSLREQPDEDQEVDAGAQNADEPQSDPPKKRKQRAEAP